MTSQLNIFLVNGLFIFLAVYVFLWKKRRHGKLLRDNERRLLEMAGKIRLIIDSVPVCIAYVDAEQRYRFVNRNYARLFGREPQEMAGGSIEEMLGDKFHTKIEDSIQQVLAGKEITLLNQMIAGKGAIHLQTRYLPHINEQGSVIGFFVQHYDITELSLTEEALRVSEKRYRAVFETSGSAMIIIEADTTISLANEEYVKMCGYSKEEIEGKMSWVDCVASVDRDRMLRYHRQLRIDPALAPANYEFRFVDRAGTVRDIMTTVAIIPGTERSVQSCLDITGLKQTERLLAGEKAALELIVRDTPLVDVLNLLCKNIEEQAFGALCSILLLDDSGSLLCHAAAPSLPEEYNKVIEGTRIGMNVGSCGTAAFTGQEVVVSDIATDQRWAKYWKLPLSYGLRACWSKPILSTSGAVLGTFAVYYNRVRTPDPAERLLMERAVHMASIVIGRKRAAEKLRQVQLHQRAILDNIPDLVWLKDRDSRFITVNKAFASASGMSPEELCGKTDLDIWPVDLAEKYRHDDRYVMDSGSQNRIEEEIAWMDGRRKWSETIKMPVYDENGGLIGTTGVARDIHERKRAEEELRESEERFHNIFDQSGDAIILFRLDTFVIIDANPAALELFGGDPVVVNVLGRNITATIANMRTVDWESLGINFVMVFSPNSFRGAPHTHLATLTYPGGGTPAQEATVIRSVAENFPMVTAVRVKDALEAVGSIVANLVLAIRGASGITLIAAALVLGGALAAGHRHRVYDAVILKTLGATRFRLLAAYTIEYLLLGAATAIFGVISGSLAAWLIVSQLMHLSFAWLPWPAFVAALTAVVATVALGLAGTYMALGQKPAPILRNL